MKTPKKVKKLPTKAVSKHSRRATPAVVIVHATHPILRHFRLVEHKHTGKLIHHRHTSHVALIGLLALVGVFLFVTAGFGRVQADTGTVAIGVVVPGPAPTVGAVITSPKTHTTITDQSTVQVTGTCANGTFVVVQDNNNTAGSTVCTVAGIFVVQVQLQVGVNVLGALNYDNLNQAGPATALVSVMMVTSNPVLQQLAATPLSTPSVPIVLPANPSIVAGVTPGISSCDSQRIASLPTGGVPQVAVSCVPRFVQANTQYTLGVTAWGGVPPYAFEVDKGDGSNSILHSLAAPGTAIIHFSYASSGVYTVKVNLTDQAGYTAISQTSVQTTGGGSVVPIAALTSDITSTAWFKTPVPLYLTAVAITLGFWGGDIFDRYLGARKPRRSRRAA